MLITRDDLQRIGDEATLLHFLQEKLNLPISEEASLAQIALPLPLPFLGLDDAIAGQIIDCQDFSGLPKDGLGERRPFLIRFKRESGYSEILREVAEGLFRRDINPAEIFFICADEDFRPFAFAYFDEAGAEYWHTEVLTIFAWTQDNTHIYTSSEHDLPTGFFAGESLYLNEGADIFDNEPLDILDILDNQFIGQAVKSTSPEILLVKLKNIGTPLVQNTYAGIVSGGHKPYLIDDKTTAKQLIDGDSKSKELIKPIQRNHEKWKTQLRHLIWIPSTKDKRWPWSDANTEEEAEQIFAETYPTISKYLNQYRDVLKSYAPCFQGKFYWEFPSAMSYSNLQTPKILYPFGIKSLRASYDETGEIIPRGLWFIPTEDMSLLAILNSKFFSWYAQAEFKKSGKKVSDLVPYTPIASQTSEQKSELLDWVKQILVDPTSNDVPAIEQEIDQLVYKLYELTSAEIALIEEETNK